MANLSNINNKFIVADVATATRVSIGITTTNNLLTLFGTGAGNATLQIEGEGGADPYINFLANNAQHWSLGIDDSDSDKFKLSEHSALGTNDYFVVDTSGNVGIGETSPDSTLTVGGNFTATTTKPTVSVSNTTSGGSLGIRGLSPILAFDKTAGGVPKILMDGGGLEFKNGTLDAKGDVHLKIDTSGNVGIGGGAITSPTSVGTFLNITGRNGIGAGTAGIVLKDYDNAAWDIWNSGGILNFRYNNGASGAGNGLSIDTTSNATFAGNVTGGNGTFTNLTINATEKLRFDGAGGHTYIEEDSNDTLIFATGGTTRLTLDSNATFAGNIYSGLNGMMEFRSSAYNNRQIGIDSQGFYVFNPVAVSGGRYDLKINDSGNAIFAGNVGIAATPGTYLSSIRALRIGQGASFSAFTNSLNTYVSSNVRVDATGTNKAIVTGESAQYRQSDGTHIWYNAASVSAGATSTLTERMRIDSSGNVTVNEGNLFLGATSSKTGTAYFWSNANDSRMSIANTGSAFELRATYLSTAGYKPIDFYTSDSLSMSISSDGDVLIGKSTSDIEVVGFRIDGVSKGRTFASIVNTNATYYVRDTTNTLYRFYVTGAGQIHATSTSISSLSDVTLKENIKPLETGLDEVMKLQPRRFDWKNGDEKNIAGFVAQEVEEVLPDLVSDYEYNDEETKKALKMGDMIPTLVNAIQELKAEIDELKK